VEVARQLLRHPDTLELDPDGANQDGPNRSTISVKDFATAVVGELCHKWLDMPGVLGEDSVRARMDAVERLLVASRYCFQTAPVGYLADKARSNQVHINADYGSGPRNSALASASQSLFSAPRRSGKGLAAASGTTTVLAQQQVERLTKTALMGAVGFAPPAIGAVTRILDHWIESGQLWQLQRAVAADPKVLRPAILEALSKVPAPPTLYRTATQRTTLGEVSVPEGARVIVNLAAVYAHAVERRDDSPEAWFFGGKHGGASADVGTTRHGCPGRSAGVIVIEEIVRALLQQKNLRRERRMLISYDREA
jgi:hypothetical protein